MDKIDEIGLRVMRWQEVAQSYDDAVANRLDLSSRELNCLSVLYRGMATPSEISQAIKLSPAATTALLDRLERKALVARRRDDVDRRKVFVEMTEAARTSCGRFYEPMESAGRSCLESFAPDELAVIERFLERATSLQEQALEEILGYAGDSNAAAF